MSYSSLSSTQTSRLDCTRLVGCQRLEVPCHWSSEDKRLVPLKKTLQYFHFDRFTLQSGPLILSVPTTNAAIIDPSTPWLIIPQSLVALLHSLILSTVSQHVVLGPRGASMPFSFPCSTLLGISLELKGANLTIPTHDLIPEHSNSAHAGACISNLHTWLDPNENSLVLGSSFMHTIHVTGSARDCFGATGFDKRHLELSKDDHDSHWKKAVIGGAVGGVVGAAFLAVGAFLLFRLARGSRRRRDISSRSIEFTQPTERQLQQPVDKPTGYPPTPHASSSRSPDIPMPLLPSASPDVKYTSTASAAGPSSLPQPPARLRLQRIDRGSEVRTSSGSQFTEHFSEVPAEYVKSRSPLGDKPLPHIPFYPLPPTSSSQAEGSTQPGPTLSFVPFDTHLQRTGPGTASSSSHHRKDSTSPKNSLPPGAASPIESIGSYKPAEQSHSRDVSI